LPLLLTEYGRSQMIGTSLGHFNWLDELKRRVPTDP